MRRYASRVGTVSWLFRITSDVVIFCKDHRDKIEVSDPLVVDDLISDKLNYRRKLARLIKQHRDIISLYCLISLANFRFWNKPKVVLQTRSKPAGHLQTLDRKFKAPRAS